MYFNRVAMLAWISPPAQATSPNGPLHCLCFTESCDGRGPSTVPQVSAALSEMTVQRSTFMMIYLSQSLFSNGNSFAGVPDALQGQNGGCGAHLQARIVGDHRVLESNVETMPGVQQIQLGSTEVIICEQEFCGVIDYY